MKSTDSLTILSNFKTLQQSSEWSCGVDSALMVLNYYDKLGSYTEESLANFRTNKLEAEATSLRSMINIFECWRNEFIQPTIILKKRQVKK